MTLGPIGVPADRVAAAEHRQRAERSRAGRRSRASCGCRAVLPGARAARSSRPSAADEPRANAGRAGVRGPSVSSWRRNSCSCRSRAMQLRARMHRAERVRQLGRVPAAHREAPGKPANAGRRVRATCTRRLDVLHVAHVPRRRADRAGDRSAPQNSSLAATTISAAADGVGARRSATKSAIVTSVSWPTAEITGTGDARSRARRSPR